MRRQLRRFHDTREHLAHVLPLVPGLTRLRPEDPGALPLVASSFSEAHQGPFQLWPQIDLLKDMLPGASLVVILANPANSSHSAWVREANAATRSLRLKVQTVEARTADEFDSAFAALTSHHASGLLALPDAMFLLHRTRIAGLAATRRVPAMNGLKEHVDAGGLVFYGPSLRDSFRRAATYVDKIIKGAHPGDLPIEQPAKFELVVNMKVAKALGLTIPRSLLARADEVIE